MQDVIPNDEWAVGLRGDLADACDLEGARWAFEHDAAPHRGIFVDFDDAILEVLEIVGGYEQARLELAREHFSAREGGVDQSRQCIARSRLLAQERRNLFELRLADLVRALCR
ncbi:MAG: hypothetical protein K2Y42_17970 [Hyphomicrobium sp.]|uniref:hypothetical protein n=1 Tax=Hyphomicrobium sp. TaxID=82 RepID=UPI0025C3251E|nr:hypothetical protein [Hyphomicrobium sp.]MBX9864629.1 hypothetical protein [Hyphomicrobium sp.]